MQYRYCTTPSFPQNTRMCTIANNFLGDNAAGIYVETHSNVISNALYANISNNVIIYTTHGEPLHIEGHYFQVSVFSSSLCDFNKEQDCKKSYLLHICKMFDFVCKDNI